MYGPLAVLTTGAGEQSLLCLSHQLNIFTEVSQLSTMGIYYLYFEYPNLISKLCYLIIHHLYIIVSRIHQCPQTWASVIAFIYALMSNKLYLCINLCNKLFHCTKICVTTSFSIPKQNIVFITYPYVGKNLKVYKLSHEVLLSISSSFKRHRWYKIGNFSKLEFWLTVLTTKKADFCTFRLISLGRPNYNMC